MTALARPKTGLLDVRSDLADFAITTFDVDPGALAASLPPGLEPDVRTLADGRTRAFVSAVSFVNDAFRVGFFPFLSFRFAQTNYRAYVKRDGVPSVWFFGTTLASAWVAIPRHAWSLPWHRVRVEQESRWAGERCERYRFVATGAVGAMELDAEGTGEPVGTLDGFADDEETAIVLTHPLVGYLRRRSGPVATYSVWHERLRMERARARVARFALFEELGLVPPEAAPHSVLVTRATEFLVFLPPRDLRA